MYIPFEIVNIILDFEGRFQLKKNNLKINIKNKFYNYIKDNLEYKNYILNNLPNYSLKLVSINNYFQDSFKYIYVKFEINLEYDNYRFDFIDGLSILEFINNEKLNKEKIKNFIYIHF
jgi:hypothetical protein